MIGGGTFTHAIGSGLFLFPQILGIEIDLVGYVTPEFSLTGIKQDEFPLIFKAQQAP